MGKIIHRINAPLIPRIMMTHMSYAVNHGITHINIGTCHINPGPEDLLPILIHAVLHILKKLKVLLNAPVSVRTVLTRRLEVSPVLLYLLRAEITDKGLTLLYKLDSRFIHLIEIIRCKEQPVFKIGTQPLYVSLYGFDKFRLLLCRVGIVKP